MNNDPQQSEPRAKRAWTVILAWIGGISAVLAFIGAVTGFFGNIQNHFHHNAQVDSQMAVAQSQARQGDYQASVQSYADILKTEPLYQPALDQQLQSSQDARLSKKPLHALLLFRCSSHDDAGRVFKGEGARPLLRVLGSLGLGKVASTNFCARAAFHIKWNMPHTFRIVLRFLPIWSRTQSPCPERMDFGTHATDAFLPDLDPFVYDQLAVLRQLPEFAMQIYTVACKMRYMSSSPMQ
jgi:hypothetical protein